MKDADHGPPAELTGRPCCAATGWGLPLALAVAIAVAAWVLVPRRMAVEGDAAGPHAPAGAANAAESWSPSPPPEPSTPTAALAIDFGNGARREFERLPWHEGMTVGDLMRAARTTRPAVAYETRGEGAATFLVSLEGVANEQAGGRNWLYRVGDQPGDASFEVKPLAAGDRVLWEFRRGE
jgi:hypothetical protein